MVHREGPSITNPGRQAETLARRRRRRQVRRTARVERPIAGRAAILPSAGVMVRGKNEPNAGAGPIADHAPNPEKK